MDKIAPDTNAIWMPALSIVNLGSFGEHNFNLNGPKCIVTSRGYVSCTFTNVFDISCTPDLQYWPFDTQTCSIAIGTLRSATMHLVSPS